MESVEIKPGTRMDQLLKYTGVVSTGGEAKIRIQEGEVKVNGTVERRRGYKLKDGDVVEIGGISLKIFIEN